MKHPYISITGTMGSGKTTAAGILAKAFGYTLLEENFGENAFLPRFYGDMKRWAFHSQTFFLMEKITQILGTPVLLEKNAVIQDTPIEQDVYSYAQAQKETGHIDDAEWALYMKIYTSFSRYFKPPDLIVHLRTSIPVLYDRITARGRGFEKTIPESYLTLLDSLNTAWISKFTGSPVVVIDTDTLNIVKDSHARESLLTTVKDAIRDL